MEEEDVVSRLRCDVGEREGVVEEGGVVSRLCCDVGEREGVMEDP